MADERNNVETLEIKVVSNTKDATDGLAKLVGTLNKLKNVTKGNNGFDGLQKSLESITATASKLESGAILKLRYLAQGLKALGEVKISKTIEERLFNIGAAVDLLKDIDMTKLTELTGGLQTFSSVGNIKTPVAGKASVPGTPAATASLPDVSQTEQAVTAAAETLEESKSKFAEFAQVARSAFASVKPAAKSLFSAIGGFLSKHSAGIKKFGSSIGRFLTAPFRKAKEEVTKFTGSFGRFFAMFKKRAMYRMINGVISAITDGFKTGVSNLYQYSKAINGPFADSMDRIATALLYFKNSIGAAVGPLINMLAPAIEFVTDKAVEFLNTINQLFARLSGASTWTKAIRYPKEYAEAADDAKKANEELKRTILGFDELNVLQDNKSKDSSKSKTADDYSKMFEEVALTAADNPFAGFFEPFKAAWDNEGQNTINSIKKAFGQVKDLIGTVGQTFAEVWKNGTGQQTVESLLRIFQNLVSTVGNLAESLSDAWKEGDNGLRIVQGLWDIFNSILGTIERITKATSDWAAELDLSPLLNSIAGLIEALNPLIDTIGGAISGFYTSVLLPILTWVIETALPHVIGLVAEVTNAVNALIAPLTSGLLDFWQKIQPIVQWLESTAIEIIDKVKEQVQKITDVLTEKGPTIADTLSRVGSAIAAIWQIIRPIADFLKNEVMARIDLIGDIVSGDIATMTDVLHGFVMFLQGAFTGDWQTAWDGIEEIFGGVWDGSKKKLDAFVDYNGKKLDNLLGLFGTDLAEVEKTFSDTWSNVKESVSDAWNSISTKASECWNGIKTFFAPAIDWFSKLFGSVKKTLSDIFHNIGVIASGCWEVIKQVFSPVANWFNTKIIQPLSAAFTKVWNFFKDKATEAWEGVKKVFSRVADFFRDTFEKAWRGIVNVFSVGGEIFVKIKDGVLSGFKWVVNKLIDGINSAVAVPFNGINAVLRWLRDITIVGIQPFTGIREINIPQIPYLAQGGMVNAGTMFIAGEAGAEVVAQMGSRTGVMNTDEMQMSVERGIINATGSIANAVAAAVVKANQGGVAPTVEVTVKADSETLYKTVKKGEKYYNNRYHVVVGV